MGKNKQQRELARKRAAKFQAQQATKKGQEEATKAAQKRAAWAAKVAKDEKTAEDAKKKRDLEDEALVAQCLKEDRGQSKAEARPPRQKRRWRSTRATKTIYVDSDSSEDEDDRDTENKALLDTFGILASLEYNAGSNGSSSSGESGCSVEPSEGEEDDEENATSGDSN